MAFFIMKKKDLNQTKNAIENFDIKDKFLSLGTIQVCNKSLEQNWINFFYFLTFYYMY